jgi:micrococcal nuclease
MIEAGLLMGLCGFGLLQFANASAPAPAVDTSRAVAAPNPWAESERSREILSGQEGPPLRLPATSAASSTAAAPAAVRVIDGDTFHYRGERIRIADIDTPEVSGQCAEERARAAEATRRLRTLLAEGPFELMRLGRDEDGYGRKLRLVIRGGQSIGDQLVAEGLARTWSGRREPWC